MYPSIIYRCLFTLLTVLTAIVECWKGIVDVFAPWVSSVQMSSDTSQPQPPCRDPESGIMGTVMEYFVESVQAAHNRLKGLQSFSNDCVYQLL